MRGPLARERRRAEEEAAREWHGSYRPYDLVKEFTIAVGVILGLALVLTILFSSPDLAPTTIQQWSRSDPVDFVTTATTEFDAHMEKRSSGSGDAAGPILGLCLRRGLRR